MKRDVSTSSEKAPQLPPVWEYSDYRTWLTDTFRARKAIHSWYSYGVLAQRAGFKARDYLLRVMRGDKKLSADGATRLAGALDLSGKEQEYFLALVEYNQAKVDAEREIAWRKLQNTISRSRSASRPRRLTSIHREILSSWHHLAIRSHLEMHPSPDDWSALGRRLLPTCTGAVVRKSIRLLEEAGLVEKREDCRWHATDKSLAISPDVGGPALRSFHRDCLHLAEQSLESVPRSERHVSGLTLGISARAYQQLCQRLDEIHLEFSQIADLDEKADQVYHLTLAFFPMTRPTPEDAP